MNNYEAPFFDVEEISEKDIIRTSGGEIDLPEMPTGGNNTTLTAEDI